MRAVELRAYEGSADALATVDKPVPKPGAGQVLVRIKSSPINPSDLSFLRGAYGIRKSLPVVPGFEASGTVVASGGGVWANHIVGRRVACAAPADGDGTWAEYMVADAGFCIPLMKSTDFEQASMMIVNPFTAWALLAIATESRARAVVQTVAASALGHMVIRLAAARGMEVVNVVRRREQVELLKSKGAREVLDSSESDFDKRLKEACKRVHATVAFDAVAGNLTGRVLHAMPTGSECLVYGGLSMEGCLLDPRSLIFERKRLRGFWLSDWMRRASALKKFSASRSIQKLLKNEFKTEIRARLPLEQAAEGVRAYEREMTGGKILLMGAKVN